MNMIPPDKINSSSMEDIFYNKFDNVCNKDIFLHVLISLQPSDFTRYNNIMKDSNRKLDVMFYSLDSEIDRLKMSVDNCIKTSKM